jgi:hypothetical protein
MDAAQRAPLATSSLHGEASGMAWGGDGDGGSEGEREGEGEARQWSPPVTTGVTMGRGRGAAGQGSGWPAGQRSHVSLHCRARVERGRRPLGGLRGSCG